MSTHNARPLRGFAIAISLLLVIVLGVTAVAAQDLVQPDKRLNQTADFGGDALYCVDKAFNPTMDSATFDHFLLLDKTGQPLWTLDRSVVEEGLGQIKTTPNQPQLLGNGDGSFGQINLYSNVAQDGSPYFIFMGFDDHSKPNHIIFYGCSPVGNAVP
jgi:hypothetical protein